MTHDHAPRPGGLDRLKGLVKEPFYWLLLAVPVAVVLHFAGAGELWVFLASAVAIVPLAGLMGRSTENLAETLGAGVGGLLNATFGNAAELIIALMMLRRGSGYHDYVKASLTGSIIGNILLVLGLAVLVGGFRYPRQTFNRTAAGMGATLLALASIGLLVPTLFFYIYHQGVPPTGEGTANLEHLSEEIACILALTYVVSLVFSLKTHQHLFAGPEEGLPTAGENHGPEWDRKTAVIVLLAATALVAVMSEFLAGSVEHAAEAVGMNKVFVGVIVVAMVGNAAEHSTAVMVAFKDKMDLAFNIAVGSSLQIALFVAPVLVFASLVLGDRPMDLHFTPLEVVALVASVAVVALVAQDGESHWMEGVMLLAVYLIFAVAFFNLPADKEADSTETSTKPALRVAQPLTEAPPAPTAPSG
jgi:Ca2+:H+ antiporter